MRPSLRHNLRAVHAALTALGSEIVADARRGGELRRLAVGRSRLRVHMGCGPRVMKEWVNLDGYATDTGVVYYNALNRLPLDDCSVARIHCEHFLEHLDFDQARAFLAECRRVLEPGSTMRLIVPDAEKYLFAYVARDNSFFDKLKFLGNPAEPLETSVMVCNQMFRMGGDHCFAWDFETLALMCRRAGFLAVDRSEWLGGPPEHQIDGLDDWRPLESLYCELQG